MSQMSFLLSEAFSNPQYVGATFNILLLTTLPAVFYEGLSNDKYVNQTF